MPSSYWAKKLGTPPPAAPPQPVQRYSPEVLPRGVGGDSQSIQRAVNDYVARRPGQPQQQPTPGYQPPAQEFVANTTNPTHVSDVLPIWQWQGSAKGGAGETQRVGACPECGSNNYFSRSSGAVFNINSGKQVMPAPECFECGYPRQQGALGQAHVEGPAMAARQGASPGMPAGSVGALGQVG